MKGVAFNGDVAACPDSDALIGLHLQRHVPPFVAGDGQGCDD